MTPSFPEYPSGHSVVSHSAAQLLSAVIGNRPFTDETLTHLGIPGIRFASAPQAAESASASACSAACISRSASQAVPDSVRRSARWWRVDST